MVGDGHGPSVATVCRMVHKVSRLLIDNFRGVLCWPPDQELQRMQQKFHAMQGLPDVIGKCECNDFGRYVYIFRLTKLRKIKYKV